MKKIFCCLLIFILIFTAAICPASAVSAEPSGTIISETTEYFEDGSSVTTTICLEETNITRALQTLSGSKTRTKTNSDGDILYKLTVKGTFAIYSNGTVNATSATRSHTIVASGWSCKTSEAHTSGAKAIATGTFVKKVLGITTTTKNTTVTLSCDVNGNLS